MLNSMVVFEEGRKNGKKPRQAISRKGCMKGKGGPENATCMYKGVRQRTWGKWVAEIREPNCGARLWLGTFDTSYEAAMAYDAAAHKLYGSEAMLNLPELVATTRFSPSTRSFPIKYPDMINIEREFPIYQNLGSQNLTHNALLGVNPISNSGPIYEKVEEMSANVFSENLNVNLPEFDDSSIWKEAILTMDFQAMADPGIFVGDFDDEKNWEAFKFPWGF